MLARLLLLLVFLLLPQSTTPGGPPSGPLSRTSPKVYDFTFSGTLYTEIPPADASQRGLISVADAPIVLPVIMRGQYSMVNPSSISGRLWMDGNEDRNAIRRMRLDADQAFGLSFIVLPVAQARCQTLRFEYRLRLQSWRSRIDEAAAARLTWPQDWPAECRDALKPQMFIESDDPRFAQFVARVSDGRLRHVPPYLAAKDLIRATIDALRISGNGTARGAGGVLHGMEVQGAAAAMTSGNGGPHDLVCACIAVLRAAGIPARPVIGLNRDQIEAKDNRFWSWGEFYLPGAGWVPFDPNLMRSAGLARRNVRDAWPYLGTMDDLDERIPISYAFSPPRAGLISHGYPAVYGWDPRPRGVPPTTNQYISMSSVGRGAGVQDPR